MYWKDELHEKQYHDLMSACDVHPFNKQIGALCYLIAATFKGDRLIEFFSSEDINVEGIKEKIKPYSSSEKALIRLGLELWNDDHAGSQTLVQLFSNLDEKNTKVVFESLKLRFN